jgi:hypothetical protein
MIAAVKRHINSLLNNFMSLLTIATNPPTGDGHRNGAVRGRSQTRNPKTSRWVKRDTGTGRFMDQKADPKPFKGVRKEK